MSDVRSSARTAAAHSRSHSVEYFHLSNKHDPDVCRGKQTLPVCSAANKHLCYHAAFVWSLLWIHQMPFKTTWLRANFAVHLSTKLNRNPLKLLDLKSTAAVSKWAPCCRAGAKRDTTAAGLVRFGLPPLALQDADTTPSVRHNQADVLFHPPTLSGQPSGQGTSFPED